VRNCFQMITELLINNTIYWTQVQCVGTRVYKVTGIEVGSCAFCVAAKHT
jgi:hypothetical protein